MRQLPAAVLLTALLAACASNGKTVAKGDVAGDKVALASDLAPSDKIVLSAESYRLDAGDKVRITVFNEENLSGEFEIDGKGSLAYPLVGTIEAAGLAPRELEKALVARLNQGYLRDPSVSVEVLSYRPFYIIGEVRTPGSYPYVNDMTVLNAVALAGGYTYRARTGSAVIKRSGSSKEEDVEPTTQVFPGDVITIKERYF